MPPPDRWDAYCPMGKVIPGTKFIAFKVPLKEALMQNVEEKDRFSPSILMTQLGEKNLTLAGVIDLTFTWKYYNKEEFLTKSVGHKKVFTKGHEVPSNDVYKEFTEAVESFSNDENLIGVHCTHGVNRTGYLICRYMIEKMNMTPQGAIDAFNSARGHYIERENYITDLKRRKSGEQSVDCVQDRSTKKKPRWRHHKADHPNWRQRSPGPPVGNSVLPQPPSRFDADRFQPPQNPRFAPPHYSRPRETQQDGRRFHYQNDRNYNPHSYRHGSGGFDGWREQQWQDPSFHSGHHNGYRDPHHQRPERYTGRGHNGHSNDDRYGGHYNDKRYSGHYNDERYHGGGRYPNQRFPRHY